MTNKKIKSDEWENLPTEQWNTTTVHAFLIDETKRRFDAEYTPGGRGAKSKRWAAEKGMIKRELDNRGPAVVRSFIEICWREYFTSDKTKYPYPTFGFMLGFMDRYWTDAEREVSKSIQYEQAVEQSENNGIDDDWF